jgi:hypothetical protein
MNDASVPCSASSVTMFSVGSVSLPERKESIYLMTKGDSIVLRTWHSRIAALRSEADIPESEICFKQ